jgi:hypothetical protein
VANLPFETAPEQKEVVIGNERTGTLKFPVYGDLTVQESAWMAAEGSRKTAFNYTSKVALKIARDKNAKPIDTHSFVAKVLAAAMGAEIEFSAVESDWQVEYVRDLEDCAMKVLEVSVAQQQMLVTAMIRHRLPDMGHWEIRDTAGMSSELCGLIYEFAMTEQSRGEMQDPIKETVQEVQELLGKSKTAPTPTPSQSTGRKRSTRAASSSPAKKNSAPSDSEASEPDSSSSASPKE